MLCIFVGLTDEAFDHLDVPLLVVLQRKALSGPRLYSPPSSHGTRRGHADGAPPARPPWERL
eukprot:4395042-Pyramimonas_sp.AAC.1